MVLPGKNARNFSLKITVIFVSCLLIAAVLPAKDLEIVKDVAGFRVVMRIDRNPPIKGDNAMEIVLLDSAGGSVPDAKILVNYYMPPMPRMAPMNYKKEARPKKDKYGLKMNLIMEGPWIIVMKIAMGGKTLTARFNISVV